MKELTCSGSVLSIAQAIEEMKTEMGESFSYDRINLAELERRTGVTRSRLRTLQKNGFRESRKSGSGKRVSKLSRYEGLIDAILREGVSNSSVIYDRIRDAGYAGGLTILKEYIAAHKDLIPAKRALVAPQGNRGRLYTSEPGEVFQMDWGLTDVVDPFGQESQVTAQSPPYSSVQKSTTQEFRIVLSGQCSFRY